MQRKKEGKIYVRRHPAIRLLGLLLAVMMIFQSLTPLEVKAASAALALTDSAGNNLTNGATVTDNVAKIYFGTPNCYYRVFYGNGTPVQRDYEDVTGIKVLEIHPGGAEHLIEWFNGENVWRQRYRDWVPLMGNTYKVNFLGDATLTRSGNGILDIYTVSINEFNDWSQNILRRDGSTRSGWNYDIVCFGFNDANGVGNDNDSVLVTYANGSTGRVTTKFLSPGGRDTMAAYLASGGGTVFGHDTIVNNYVQWGSYSNTSPEHGEAYYLGYTPDANHFRELAGYCGIVIDDSQGPVISSTMTKKKSGLLTTYPFSMPDNMNVVSTHSLGQVASGADVWYTLDNSGTPYLMTFRNTAMTQAGHTAQSTMQRQEKLLLANTIFYVNQFLFSGDTVSVPDTAAPSAPTITVNGGANTCSFSAADNGTPYQLTGYLWEKNNTGNMWDNSTANYQTNTVTVNSTTGVAGYYYLIDQSASTVITPQTSGISSGGSNINIASNYLTGTYYIHAIAVDKNGNYSTTATLKLSSQHTLVYDANGGTGAPASQTVVKGQTNTISKDIPQREGYTFKYWTTTPYDLTNDYHYGVVQPKDGPYIKRIWFNYINATTMEVLVYAEGTETVKVPTWTTLNGQDDLVWHTLNKGSWTVGGQTFNFGGWIYISDHNGEVGEYQHHVYAYDSKGNELQSAAFRNHGFIYKPGATYAGYMNGGTQTLYAQWQPNTHTLVYDANGGTGAPASQTIVKGQTNTISKDIPQREGYTFKYWTTTPYDLTNDYHYRVVQPIESDGNKIKRVWFDYINPTTMEILVYAEGTETVKVPTWTTLNGQDDLVWHTLNKGSWTAGGQTFNFGGWIYIKNHNGEVGEYIHHVYAYDSKGNELNSARFRNHGFIYRPKDEYAGYMNGGTQTLYAQWRANDNTEYKVEHYIMNKSDDNYSKAGDETQYGTAGATVNVSDYISDTYNGNGFTYNHAEVGSTTVTETPIKADGSLVIRLYYTRNTSTLKVNPNGGTWKGSTASQSFEQRYETTKQIDSPGERTGYKFTGWTLTHSSGGNGTINGNGENGGSITYTYGSKQNGVDTLKAGWNAINYTITYDLDGGALKTGETNPTSYTITTSTFTLKNPEKKGYTFAGWTGTGLSSAATTVTIAKGSTGNRSYKATWTKNAEPEPDPEYTVTLNKGTGIDSVTGTGTYHAGDTVTINATVSTGYTWINWTGYSTQTTKQYTFTMPAQNVTFTANAIINSSTLKVDPNGGSWNGSSAAQSFSGNYGSIEDIPDPDERHGYNFNGWILSSGANGIFDSSTKKYTYGAKAGTTDVLTAQWSEGNVAYKVVHHTQNTDGSTYTKASTETKYGTTGSSITASALKSSTYDGNGFTYNHAKVGGSTVTSATIKADGSLIIDLYYDRNSYGYTVKHYFQNIANNEYTLVKSVDGTAFYNAKVTGVLLTDEQIVSIIGKSDAASGFTKPLTSTVTITTDTGKNVISYYYSRNSFTLKLTSGTGISTVSGAGTYKYEAPVTIDATVKTGYTWKNWSDDNKSNRSVTETKKYTFTNGMPANVVAYTANAAAHVYIIRYELNGGRLPDGRTNPETYTIESASFQLINPERTGYDFLGWTGTGLDGKTKDVTIAQGSYGNRTYSAEWEVHKYTIRFDGNGATEGSMADIEAAYNVEMELPANVYVKENEYGMSTFLGWGISMNSRDVAHADRAVVKNLLSENGAVITLYAVWDDCPGIEAKDLYYTLEQAQSGYITEMELLSHASASDMEDREILPGTHEDVGNSFRVMDYAESDFTQFVHSGSVTENYRVMDSSGNSYTEQITVYIVDTHPDTVVTLSGETDKEGTTRFINEKYYALSLENGGLSKDSVWKADPEYSTIIERSFYNQRSGIPEQIFTFSHDEILQMKEFIQENGIGNLKSQDALQRFYQKFAP